MTVFQYINTNIDRIKTDVKMGIVPCSVLAHYEIYSRFDLYKRMGNSTVMAVFFVSEEKKVGANLVYNIKRKMEQEYESTNNKLQPVNADKQTC